MTIEAAPRSMGMQEPATSRTGGVIHPRWVRITHWVNALAMFIMTQNLMLLFISGGAVYRLFSRDYPTEDDNGALVQYIGLIVLLALLVAMTESAGLGRVR